jgi:hypothetical protein
MKELSKGYSLENQVLLYNEKLCINRYTPLYTRLIQEVHSQPSSAHCSSTKTYQLLATRYHWINIGSNCKQYVANCVECRHFYTSQSKQPGLLHPLSIPSYPIQHLTIDFKDFPLNKHRYNYLLMFIDRLFKASVSIPCYKDINSRGIAKLFVT